MPHLPNHPGHLVTETSIQNELLLALVKTIEHQNAILDDTIHGELKRIADSQERVAHALLKIVARTSIREEG